MSDQTPIANGSILVGFYKLRQPEDTTVDHSTYSASHVLHHEEVWDLSDLDHFEEKTNALPMIIKDNDGKLYLSQPTFSNRGYSTGYFEISDALIRIYDVNF